MPRKPQPNSQVRLKETTHARLKGMALKSGVDMTDIMETLVNLAFHANLKDLIHMANHVDTCPGDYFSDERICDMCGLTANYHKSDVYLKRFVNGVTALIKGEGGK